MLEIPESKTVGLQAGQTITVRKIKEVITATSPHKFAFYKGNPADYKKLLEGKQVLSANGHGMFVDIFCEGDTCITIGDGTNMRYYSQAEQPPVKHQLMIIFDDESRIAFTVAMYGVILAYKGFLDNPYHQKSLASISPLEDAFDESVFEGILKISKDLSAKALLATEQRIPGLGNGVLQDILFNAGIHPKRKKSKLSDFDKSELFHSLKMTLKKMTESGGRDTERDFFGNSGRYKTILSKNTFAQPCPNCGEKIIKEAYLGGAVYYCPNCQKI